jgi:phage tail sheath gpL-like
MGTLALALTGFSSVLPGQAMEVRFAQGQVSGDASVKRVLFIGAKTSAGTATPDTVVYDLQSENEAITYFGAGSKIHRMVRRFLEVCKSAKICAIAATESGGSVATDAVTFAGAAGSNGVVSYTLCGDTITLVIPNGQSAADSATALIALVNLQTHWPVVASSGGAGIMTVSAKIKGTDGYQIRHHVSTTTTTQTVACGAANLATAGATDEVYTTVLSTIAAADYDYIVLGVNPKTTTNVRIGDIREQVVSQALPSTNIRQQLIYGCSLSPANAVTLASQSTDGPANQPQCSCINLENSEWEPMELAAWAAAIRYNNEAGTNQCWANYDSYGIVGLTTCPIPKPYSAADYPSPTEQAAMIVGGVSPIAVDALGRCYLVQMVTCSTDVRVRDVAKVTVSYKWCDDLAVRYATKWVSCGIQDDTTNENYQPPPNVVTPDRLKTLTIQPLYMMYADKDHGWLDSAKTLTAITGDMYTCATGIDPVVATRINAITPLHVMPLCHQFNCLVTENSAG